MITAITIFHIIVCVLLVLLVLVQDSKGAMGATFGGGGGANSLFGAAGAETVFSKATKILAIIFAVTCVFLTRYSSQKEASVFKGASPATQAAPAQPPVETAPADAAPAEAAPTNSEEPSTSK